MQPSTTAATPAQPSPSPLALRDIVAEAADIMRRIRDMPRNQPKSPAQIARLVELLELSGLDATSFARKIGASGATLLFWSKGKKASGDRWEALEAEIARRRGAGLAALMNAGLAVDAAPAQAPAAPSPEPAKPVAVDAAPSAPAANEPPAQERSGRTTLAGDCARIVEILRDLGGRATRTALLQRHLGGAWRREVEGGKARLDAAAAHAAGLGLIEVSGTGAKGSPVTFELVGSPVAPAERRAQKPARARAPVQKPARKGEATAQAPALDKPRVVEVLDSGVLVVETLRLVREEVLPGTPAHTAHVRAMFASRTPA